MGNNSPSSALVVVSHTLRTQCTCVHSTWMLLQGMVGQCLLALPAWRTAAHLQALPGQLQQLALAGKVMRGRGEGHMTMYRGMWRDGVPDACWPWISLAKKLACTISCHRQRQYTSVGVRVADPNNPWAIAAGPLQLVQVSAALL